MILRRADLDALLDRINDLQRTTDELAQRSNDLLHRQAVRLSERDFLVRTWYGWSVVPAEDEALLAWMLDVDTSAPAAHRSTRMRSPNPLMCALRRRISANRGIGSTAITQPVSPT